METAYASTDIRPTLQALLKRKETWAEITRLYRRNVSIAQIAELILQEDTEIEAYCCKNKNPIESLERMIQYYIRQDVPLQDRIDRVRLHQFMKDQGDDLDAIQELNQTIVLQKKRTFGAYSMELKMGMATEQSNREMRLLMDAIYKLAMLRLAARLPLSPLNTEDTDTPCSLEQEQQAQGILVRISEKFGLTQEQALVQVLGLPMIESEKGHDPCLEQNKHDGH